MTKWQRIGEIPVDSGQVVLVDPVNSGRVHGYEMDSSLSYELVENGAALVLSTGLGDGTCPVEARLQEVAGAVRIAEVRIRFL
jgi:hypothetical protein